MDDIKEMNIEDLEKAAGGEESGGRIIYNFKCSCGNIVMKGNAEPPKFPCPKCMKKEWEFAGSNPIRLTNPKLKEKAISD